MKSTCRLVALCSDSPVFDLRVMSAIIAHAVALTPTGEETSTSCSLSAGVEEYDAGGNHINAVMTALQGGVSSSSGATALTGGVAARSSIFGGKNNKGSRGNKKMSQPAGPQPASTFTSPTAPTAGAVMNEGAKTMTTDTVQRSRPEWYSVVENPQWSVPVAFIHQLPDFERLEDEEGVLSFTNPRNVPTDFAATLHRALEIISEDVSNLTTTETGGMMQDGEERSALGQNGGMREILVVLALQDIRTLLTLMNCRGPFTSYHIDTRLIINFRDGRPTTTGTVRGGGVSGSSNTRSRATTSNKRVDSRDSPMLVSATVASKDFDSTSSLQGGGNALSMWIERQEREGLIKAVTLPATASSACGLICLSETFEDGAEDKKIWVQQCVRRVLPTMHHIARNMTQYTEWLSSKPVHRFSVISSFLPSQPLPQQQQQQQQQQEDMCFMDTTVGTPTTLRRSGASTMTPQFSALTSFANYFPSLSAAGVVTPTAKGGPAFFLSSPQALCAEEEEDWSYYIRERKVCGQWTCVSAARALATQVTVSLAREQEPVVVQPAHDERNQMLEVDCEHSQSCKKANENMGQNTDASLLLQLKRYSSKRTVLATTDTEDYADIGVLSGGKLDTTMRSLCSTTRVLPSTAVEPENEYNQFSETTTLPIDHTMDRPTTLPSPEEVEWLTRQFVKKGLGAFTLPQVGDVKGPTSFSYSDENFMVAMTMRELLEEPLNGQMLDDCESAADKHVSRLIEGDLKRTEEKLISDFNYLRNAVVALFGTLQVDEKLKLSVERSLTPREQTHILQQVYLEFAAIQLGMSGMLYPTTGPLSLEPDKQEFFTHINFNKPFFGFTLRPFEEHVTTAVATCRIYAFQSRFGAHLCRLLQCKIPETLEAVNGNITALYSTQAENVHLKKRAQAMMLCGVPIPQKRHKRCLWCYYVSGIPSLDQFNELVNSGNAIASHSFSTPSSSFGPTSNMAASFGGNLGDIVRQHFLKKLQNTSQLLVASESGAGKLNGGVCRSEGALHTVLEGRHALYPHENSVVEVVTTDRGRMCRYVRTSEFSCTLHYSIPPPSINNTTNTAKMMMATATAFGETTTLTPTSRKQLRDETVYFTTAFDDGVVFTCTPHWQLLTGTTSVDSCVNEKEGVNSTSCVSTKNSVPRRRGISSKHGKQREVGLVGALNEPLVGGKRSGVKNKGRIREDNDALDTLIGEASCFEEPLRRFPIAKDGSVLLWTVSAEDAASGERSASTSTATPSATETTRRIPTLAVTVAANGVTVHNKEQEAMLWITQHEPSSHPAPELLRCMHICNASATWQRTMEVEVRRVVMEEIGAVCRYFHSGITQILYPDGTVVIRYPLPCSELDTTPLLIETLVTPAGECYVRQVGCGNVGEFLRLEANTVQTHTVYDRGHHCSIVSRVDGVIVVYYYDDYINNGDDIKKDNSTNLDTNHSNDVDGVYDAVLFDTVNALDSHPNAILRVTLHADGTCITTFSNRASQKSHPRLSAFLQPLLKQIMNVSAACDAIVRYCVEAPSLPCIFVCTSLEEDKQVNHEEKLTYTKRDAMNGNSAWAQNMTFPVNQYGGVHENVSTPISPLQPKIYDRFYIVFGDGSVLRRRVVYRGRNGNILPFLETLFTRPTETSLRVFHESGLVIVEPAETVRRNMEKILSLAIGEGFAMFDVAQGGMRLVDQLHYVTEVQDLFSSGPVRADITSVSAETLLRQLVLPTYSPHKVSKAQQENIQKEEMMATLQSKNNRVNSVCAPLSIRLRELGESFIIDYKLLRSDVFNNAKRQWEGNYPADGSRKQTVMSLSTASCWGSSAFLVGTEKSTALQTLLSSTTPVAMVSHVGIVPLFFTQLEDDVVVQYLHQEDVEGYMRAKDAEPVPIFLSHSTSAGEPGVQQFTFFRMEANAESGDAFSRLESPWQSSLSGTLSATQLRSVGSLTFGQKKPVMTGSLLGGAVQRQRALSFFSGTRVSFLTSRWLPPTLQPQRRFIRPHFDTHEKGGRSGVTILSGDVSGRKENDDDDNLFSSYERLCTFLKFSEVTQTAQYIVLLSEVQRQQQLSSMLIYQKTMNRLTSNILHVKIDEQQRLREKAMRESQEREAKEKEKQQELCEGDGNV